MNERLLPPALPQDARMFKRMKWKYLILDEAHMIKNWKSQRWQVRGGGGGGGGGPPPPPVGPGSPPWRGGGGIRGTCVGLASMRGAQAWQRWP